MILSFYGKPNKLLCYKSRSKSKYSQVAKANLTKHLENVQISKFKFC